MSAEPRTLNPEPLLTRSLLFCQPLGIHACAAETFGAAPLGRPGILPGWFCQPLGIHACAAEAFGAAPLGRPGILPGRAPAASSIRLVPLSLGRFPFHLHSRAMNDE